MKYEKYKTIKKMQFITAALLMILCILLADYSGKQADAENKEAIAQVTPSIFPDSDRTSVNDYLIKTEQEKKHEKAVKQLDEYIKINSLYNEFANNYAYLGVTINEDYINEGDISPCLIVYVYGKENWCIQTCFDENGMLSFGVTMPVRIAEEQSTLDHISELLSTTFLYYDTTISPNTINDFILSSIDAGVVESSTSISNFNASIDIQDEFITINFTEK